MHALPFAVTGLMGSFAGALLVAFFMVLAAIPYVSYAIGVILGAFFRTSYVAYAIVPSLLLIGAYHDVIGMGDSFLNMFGKFYDFTFGYICNFICVLAMCYGMLKQSRANFFVELQFMQFRSAKEYEDYAKRADMIVMICILSLLGTALILKLDFIVGLVASGVGDVWSVIVAAIGYAYSLAVKAFWLAYDFLAMKLFS